MAKSGLKVGSGERVHFCLFDRWIRERNGRTLSRPVTLGPYPASMGFDDPLSDRQSKTRVSSLVSGLYPKNFLEQVRQPHRRDAFALVED